MVRGRRRKSSNRVTVTLAKGQRQALEAIADRNQVPLAFVVRYALTELVRDGADRQLHLRFLDEDESPRFSE